MAGSEKCWWGWKLSQKGGGVNANGTSANKRETGPLLLHILQIPFWILPCLNISLKSHFAHLISTKFLFFLATFFKMHFFTPLFLNCTLLNCILWHHLFKMTLCCNISLKLHFAQLSLWNSDLIHLLCEISISYALILKLLWYTIYWNYTSLHTFFEMTFFSTNS